MPSKDLVTKFDWRKVGEYFLPKTKGGIQAFLSDYNKTTLELAEMKMNQTVVDLQNYEKALIDKTPLMKAKQQLQNFKVKEIPIQSYLKAVDESDKRAGEILTPIAKAAEKELLALEEVVKNIETSRDLADLDIKDIRKMFKKDADRVLDLHRMGYDTIPEFRKKYGDFNIT